MCAEIRSSFGRIGVRLSKKRGRHLLPMVFRDATTPHLRGKSLPDDCNRDITRLCSKYPWASLGDLDLYVAGSEKGAEWGLTQGRDSKYSDSESLVASTKA
jgi:hypothetical protein